MTRLATAGALAAAALACASGPRAELVHVSDGRPLMGTVLEITLVADDPARARLLIERCFAEGARLEAIFTTWRADGELARLNARAGDGPQPVSPELARILGEAQRFARETDGAFDVTVGPLLEAWREGARRGALPSDAELAAARARVGAERIAIDAARGTVALPEGMAADLGGLAKGWALDRLGELLQTAGVERALLNFGGSSLLALGAPLDAERWRVAVADGRGGVAGVLGLRDQSASISASLGQTLEIGGAHYGHIVDPRSGAPLNEARLAIAIARDGASAEAFSTALVVLAPREGVALAATHGVEALVEDAAGARLASAGFSRAVELDAPPPARP